MFYTSEIDNDAYCICMHDFLLCTHKKFRPMSTMYAVKISSTKTVFGFIIPPAYEVLWGI